MMQIDRSVTESYGGGGKTCITSRIYPKLAVGRRCSPLRLQQWIKYSEDCPAACMGNEQALNELRKTWNLEQERVLSLCQWMSIYSLFLSSFSFIANAQRKTSQHTLVTCHTKHHYIGAYIAIALTPREWFVFNSVFISIYLWIVRIQLTAGI